MISPDEVQEALVGWLQGYGPLVSLLPDGIEGVRESQWKGIDFKYPCVRVQRSLLFPWGTGNCASRTSRLQVTITASSKKDSSDKMQIIQGQIVAALDGYRFETSTVAVQTMRPQQVVPGTPAPASDIWEGPVTFRGIVTEK